MFFSKIILASSVYCFRNIAVQDILPEKKLVQKLTNFFKPMKLLPRYEIP